FLLADVPSQSGRVLLWNADARLPVAVCDAAATGSVVTFDLRGAAAPRGALRVRVAAEPDAGAVGDASHEPLNPTAPIEVFAWHEESGRGAVMLRRDGAFVLEGLAPAFYRLVAIGAPFGSLDLGRHWVDGRGVVDLGDCRSPVPAVLRLRDESGEGLPKFVELYLRRPDVDLRTTFVAVGDAEVELPAGTWLHLVHDAEALSATWFAVRSGAVTELPLPR
ncbi:MAG: hypothetical protein R3F29_11790, partial [Planctomycetota bacterium]